MKQECPTYLKTIRKSKALAATLSDIEPETESKDNDNKEILSAFTATVDPTKGVVEAVDEEENLVNPNLRKLTIKMTSIQLMLSCTRFLRSMRNCIGWSPRN